MQRGVLQIEIVFRPDKNYDIFRLRCSRWEGCRANAVCHKIFRTEVLGIREPFLHDLEILHSVRVQSVWPDSSAIAALKWPYDFPMLSEQFYEIWLYRASSLTLQVTPRLLFILPRYFFMPIIRTLKGNIFNNNWRCQILVVPSHCQWVRVCWYVHNETRQKFWH